MAPELTGIFCQKFIGSMNKMYSELTAAEAGRRAELTKISREADRLIQAICYQQAICYGLPGTQVRNHMTELEIRRAAIETKLGDIDTPAALIDQTWRVIIVNRYLGYAMH